MPNHLFKIHLNNGWIKINISLLLKVKYLLLKEKKNEITKDKERF